jgi:hypothetical protein
MKLLEFYSQFYHDVKRRCNLIGCETKNLDEKSRSIQGKGNGKGCNAMIIWAHPEVQKKTTAPPRILRLKLIAYKTKDSSRILSSYVSKYPPFPSHPEIKWSVEPRGDNNPFYYASYPSHVTKINDLSGLQHFIDQHQTDNLMNDLSELLALHERQLKAEV